MYLVIYKDCVLFKASTKIAAVQFINDYAEKRKWEFWQQISSFGRSQYIFYDAVDYYSLIIISIK